MVRRRSLWDTLYIVLLALAIPAGIFHLLQGRYGQALIALGATIIGGLLLAGRFGEEVALPRRPATGRPVEGSPRLAVVERDDHGRVPGWLPFSALSGFAATGVMTFALMLAYGAAAVLGAASPEATIFRRWLQALADNTLTATAQANAAVGLALHFIAGITWALVYGALAEPRLAGPGWRRGAMFSLVPWALSVLVFLPAMGAGFLGAGLEAGPLPVLGNLVLHLVYGVTLGQVYASTRMMIEAGMTPDPREVAVLGGTERMMAAGLIPGVLAGAAIGLVGSSIFAPASDPATVMVFGALVGSALGTLIGSFVGLGASASPR